MKFRLFLIIVLLISRPNFGQVISSNSKHNLVVWTSGGYSSILNNATEVSTVGGGAASVGAGYEYNRHYFMFQLGVELSYCSSRMSRADSLITQSLLDSQGDPYTGLFTLRNNYSSHRLFTTALPVMLGYKLNNGLYGLVGAKLLVNLVGMSDSYTTVTSEAKYPNIIGNNNGVIGNMPNHGLDTQTRMLKNEFKLNPGLGVSFELGMPILNDTHAAYKRTDTSYRLALFCDYGMYTFVSAYKTNPLFINTASNGAYSPALNGFLFHNTTSATINTFVVGLKLIAVFGKKTTPCRCESSIDH